MLRALSSSLTSLTSLDVGHCNNVTNEGLQTLSSITALSALNLRGCDNVSAAAKQALRIAIPTYRGVYEDSPTAVQLLPCRPSTHTSQCDGV